MHSVFFSCCSCLNYLNAQYFVISQLFCFVWIIIRTVIRYLYPDPQLCRVVWFNSMKLGIISTNGWFLIWKKFFSAITLIKHKNKKIFFFFFFWNEDKWSKGLPLLIRITQGMNNFKGQLTLKRPMFLSYRN